MREICILGSTGSIGVSTLKVVREFPEEMRVRTLCCNTQIDLLAEQIAEFSPQYAAVASLRVRGTGAYDDLKRKYPRVTFIEDQAPLVQAVSNEHDIVVSALVGAAGLEPTIASIPHCKRLALANKESLVMAGEIVVERCKRYQTELLPIDSEHSALFMLLQGVDSAAQIDSLTVTASGGSLRDLPLEQLNSVTPEIALRHPTWKMGPKITIDSATLVNKGFEVIEAHYLFGMPYSKINVVIHPQSIVHALIEMKNGAMMAHIGVNDMVFPITNALRYPDNNSNPFARFDLAKCGVLEFREVDHERYPALALCYQAGESGTSARVVLNAANEAAVEYFLSGKISFSIIMKVIEHFLNTVPMKNSLAIDEIIELDRYVRVKAHEYMECL